MLKLAVPLFAVIALARPLFASSEPAIFGAGFTNVTDDSARIVFTTSEPATSVVQVAGSGTSWKLAEDNFGEIHALPIQGLKRGESYGVTISVATRDGRHAIAETALKPFLRPPSSHRWPGLTVFGTSLNDYGPEALDLLVKSGARMVRIEVTWYDLMREPGKVNQKYLDETLAHIAALKKCGVEPLIVLDYCVPWAKRFTDATMTWRHPSFGAPDRLEDWETYLRTVVTAVRGSARYYEIWNEPDAGYLSTGSYVERPGLPAPIGRPPFKDNWAYWLGDRFAPMIVKVRQVMDELEPQAIVMNGGWNRDYSGDRGDLLFQRGVAPSLDVYAFHTYCASPMSFSRWYQAIDGGFRRNIDRIFAKHHVSMPLAITEWGWPAWAEPAPEKGFVSFRDAQIFLVKSSFYFLSMERVELLSQFELGFGPDTRDKDPLFFMLANRDAGGKIVVQPTFATFSWLAHALGSRAYRALPVELAGAKNVKAYAIELQETGEIYLAAWQDGVPDAQGIISAAPAQDVEATIRKVPANHYAAARIDLAGAARDEGSRPAEQGSLNVKLSLPEISARQESEPVVLRLSLAAGR